MNSGARTFTGVHQNVRQQWIQEWENKVDEYNTDDSSVAHEVPDATVQHMRQHVERVVPPERQAGTFRGSRSEFLALEHARGQRNGYVRSTAGSYPHHCHMRAPGRTDMPGGCFVTASL